LCVFCGESPVEAEHVWPQWIAKYLPREKADHFRVQESAEGREVQPRGFRFPFTTEANCVCHTCNTGWMHELENSAEAEIAAMIQGKPQRLHEWRQSIAASWAFKTAMMLEQSEPPAARTIPLAIYPMFRRFLRPTTMTQVWMAHYVGENPHPFGHGLLRAQVIGPTGPVEPDDAEPYALVLGAGQLAFWIVGHLVQGAALHAPNSEVTGRIVQIWPVTPSAAWPPPEPVGDDGLNGLVFSLASP
jgi:hypothetical protein